MTKALFTEARFNNDVAARAHLEEILWPKGAVCPHCGGTERNTRSEAVSHRPGVWACGDCRSQFTVTVGTVFERSKVPLHKWVLANHLMCASKKGISSHQLHRLLGVTYKTAWFMSHRLREAMNGIDTGLLGGGGGTVEADETYWGTSPRSQKAQAIRKAGGKVSGNDKQKIISLVEREGKVRSFHVASVNGQTLKKALHEHIAKDAHLMTDDLHMYRRIGKHFASHEAVNHSKGEYARGHVSTNTVESFFALFKRGLVGTFHHVSPKHLERYLNEFDFRYNNRTALDCNDVQRADIALKGISGKRLTYLPVKESQSPYFKPYASA